MSLSPLPLEALMPLNRAADLLQLLERWVDRGWLRALDKAFWASCTNSIRRPTLWCCWPRP